MSSWCGPCYLCLSALCPWQLSMLSVSHPCGLSLSPIPQFLPTWKSVLPGRLPASPQTWPLWRPFPISQSRVACSPLEPLFLLSQCLTVSYHTWLSRSAKCRFLLGWFISCFLQHNELQDSRDLVHLDSCWTASTWSVSGQRCPVNTVTHRGANALPSLLYLFCLFVFLFYYHIIVLGVHCDIYKSA
jgi:hypothetical protein